MALTDNQGNEFREKGVLVVENVLADEDLEPLAAEYSEWIDRRARQLADEGKIADLCETAPFERRLGALYAQSPEIAAGLDIMTVRGPATFAFLRNAKILDAVSTLVGPEITCNPIQHIRAKPPASEAGAGTGFYNVPWHQDSGVTWQEADESNIVTCWVALVDATVENGCMEVMPGAWRLGHLEHQAEGGTTIRPDLLPNIEPKPVPVGRGGIVFMHRHTPHRSTPNFTDGVRWSLDLRYQPTGQPTGRPFHPDFVVRSERDPSSVLTSHSEWARRWEEALETSKGMKAHRT